MGTRDMGWLCSSRSSAAFLPVPSLDLASDFGRKQTVLPTWLVRCLARLCFCLFVDWCIFQMNIHEFFFTDVDVAV